MRKDDSDYDSDENEGEVPSFAQGDESPWVRIAVTCCGFWTCLFVLLYLISLLASLYGVSARSSMPAYARSFLWLSTGHHLDVYDDIAHPPPPPPDF